MGFETLHNENQFFRENRVASGSRVFSLKSNDKQLPEPQLDGGIIPSFPQELYLPGGDYTTRLWTPSDTITTAWYDATDADTIINVAGAVSRWDDKSGNDANLVPMNILNKAQTGTRTLNSLNTLEFNQDPMICETNFATPADGLLSVFIVAKPDLPAATWQGLWHMHDVATTTWLINVAFTAEPNYSAMAGYSPNIAVGVAGQIYNGPSIYSTVSDGAVKSYIDGNFIDQGPVGEWVPASLTTLHMMYQEGFSSGSLNGIVGEFIVVPTSGETVKLRTEGYLAWKWGLQGNLPADHPYKNAAPRI